ncbi:arasin 2-like [Portunus trituberculatus]|uniref:arasin 2-like n=1 Tax=Portunus trituberculatus TaxID=210409 RepID=UPI001E1CB9B4|nr:arasin 2-like [Portunus trituberculatus]
MERRSLLVVLLVCSCVLAATAEASPFWSGIRSRPQYWPRPRPMPMPMPRPRPWPRPRPRFPSPGCICVTQPCPCDSHGGSRG